MWKSVFNFLGNVPRRRIAGSHGNSVVFFEELLNCCPEWLHHFTLPPAVCGVPRFSIALSTFVLYGFYVTAMLGA